MSFIYSATKVIKGTKKTGNGSFGKINEVPQTLSNCLTETLKK